MKTPKKSRKSQNPGDRDRDLKIPKIQSGKSRNPGDRYLSRDFCSESVFFRGMGYPDKNQTLIFPRDLIFFVEWDIPTKGHLCSRFLEVFFGSHEMTIINWNFGGRIIISIWYYQIIWLNLRSDEPVFDITELQCHLTVKRNVKNCNFHYIDVLRAFLSKIEI